ncbi:MDR family NADP-dependent oxidoreductase [Rouxiella badensis]|uniref:MDR family NADP-dependent oxidoreductase n=1 Tax=Rouxiella badensis TaxID=1646377 RepID=UPI0019812889|nr:NADP-dependent oxidoreductase [Rouxiella badensis]
MSRDNVKKQHNIFVHQVSRPHGEPLAEHFQFVQRPLEPLGERAAWVENVHFSVDPYMRECMDGDWELNEPLEGRTIGRVIRSNTPALQPGDWVFHRKGWRTFAQVEADEVRVLTPVAGVPLRAWLSVLGGTGLTAWVALTKIARLQSGESVYISSAAGGVGSAAAQFAALLGAKRIVGSTRNAEKSRTLTDRLGYTDAFVYQSGKVSAQLRDIIPEGIDVYLDNVGGEQLEAAIAAFKDYGRAALIGAVAQYSALTPPSAPYNLFDVVGKSLTLQGFLVRDYKHLQEELEEFIIPHIQSGRVVPQDTVTYGFDHIVEAFLSMLKGGNIGKAIVSIE